MNLGVQKLCKPEARTCSGVFPQQVEASVDFLLKIQEVNNGKINGTRNVRGIEKI